MSSTAWAEQHDGQLRLEQQIQVRAAPHLLRRLSGQREHGLDRIPVGSKPLAGSERPERQSPRVP
jgi:hypothetical protein